MKTSRKFKSIFSLKNMSSSKASVKISQKLRYFLLLFYFLIWWKCLLNLFYIVYDIILWFIMSLALWLQKNITNANIKVFYKMSTCPRQPLLSSPKKMCVWWWWWGAFLLEMFGVFLQITKHSKGVFKFLIPWENT